MKNLAPLCSFVLVALGSFVACTNEESLGNHDGQTAANADSGSDGANASGGKSKVELYCSAHCIQEANCVTDPRSLCAAELSSDAALADVNACASRQECNWAKCRPATAARTQYETACKGKISACGGKIGGLSAGDCDDVSPVFRDDVLVALAACFDEACANVNACMLQVSKSAAPSACADF